MLKRILCAALVAVAVVSCTPNEINTNKNVQQVFDSMFPDAKDLEWDYEGMYHVADFRLDLQDVNAWFNQEADWIMTEYDMKYSSLPQAVKNAFEASEWANWRDKDVEKIERPGLSLLYIIEAEMGESDIELRFGADGELLEVIEGDGLYDDNIDLLP